MNNNQKATKRALLTSVMALVMCVVMLVGTTFAWFTDTASTGVNKIQAGNLDVDIIGEDGKSLDGKSLSFVKAGLTTDTGAEIDPNATTEILWEPGCRYVTEGFRIANNGNLALKWKAEINKDNIVDGKAAPTAKDGKSLLDVIDFYVVTGTDENAEAVAIENFKGNLEANKTSDVYYIKGVMKTTAGNDYQSLTLEGITITVYATQLTAEFDSFDNQYDKDAKYTEVIAGGKTFTGKATLSTGITATGHDAVAVKATGPDANVTILDGTFDGGSGGNNKCIEVSNGATVTIKDGTFTVGGDADGAGNSVVECWGGNIVIEGGFFYTNYSWNGFYYVLNQKNDKPGTITVKGGTFVNYDPSKGDDNLGGNFVAPGYSVISEKHGEDTWYTVVKGTGVTAGTQEALKDALTNADTTSNALTVKLAGGEYTLYNVDRAKTQNTELTIEGAGKDKTVFIAGDMTVTDANGEGSSDYSYEGSDVTFKNMTVNVGTGNYKGFVRAKSLYFENCTIEGRGSYWGIGSVVFKDCIFNSVNDYNIWTYAGMDFTFDNCTFNSDAGKFVNAYKDEATGTTKLTFTDCKFVAGTEDKPAVCLKGYKSNAWDVTFSGCSLTNCKTDTTTGSNYYLFGQGIESATTVTIDGSVVWANGSKVN